ncbi:hypothetical protein CJ030_MR3G018951 [Morella rubra]|uniref:Uncharacterized protein n=1 Tax=Morella rubra TaxID=262757 RepID=A0A6A1W717_9ROSI|nr:hypothetical protein CJ030_MR3G018951 [Morella rubra]
MKRQRKVEGSTMKERKFEGATMSMTKKKAKREVGKGKEEVGEVEEGRREDRDQTGLLVAESVIGWEEHYCPWLGGAVDEQMSWGSFWLPVWDIEFISEAYSTFFGDVVWDDDIWNMRSIKEVPKP